MATTKTRSDSTRTDAKSRTGSKSRSDARARGAASRARATEREAPRRGVHVTATNLRAGDRRWVERHADQLSPSTLRAKWIHSVDEHEDRPGQTLATREPAVIQAWAEDREAEPATVGRRDPNERPRSLRFDFQRGGSSRLQRVDWEAWLGTFEQRDLVFLFQEHRRNGETSNFFRLDSPDREEG